MYKEHLWMIKAESYGLLVGFDSSFLGLREDERSAETDFFLSRKSGSRYTETAE